LEVLNLKHNLSQALSLSKFEELLAHIICRNSIPFCSVEKWALKVRLPVLCIEKVQKGKASPPLFYYSMH
jgi:hypothetical protein